MRLSPEASSQPGAWACLPYQREPLDVLSPSSSYETVVLQWASQMSKTSCFLVLLAYVIAREPGPALVVQPNLEMADAFSKDRLAPMFRDTPVLLGRVAPPRSRDSGSTILHRVFTGGHVTIVGANSPAGLAARPVRYVILDEIDRYEASAGSEGNPEKLAEARARTFWNKKVVKSSTPTEKDASAIERNFKLSDQRFYHVPCYWCGHEQKLVWKNLDWPEEQPEAAQYRCEHCRELIPPHRKRWMVERGRWVAENPGSKIAGFHLSELYSLWPLRDWGVLAVEWLEAQGNIESLRVFINTSLAETWDDTQAAGIDEQALLARREDYGRVRDLPEWCAMLVAGCDVQADRIEVSVWGFGADDVSGLIHHEAIPGDTELPEVYTKLDEFLKKSWRHPWAGEMDLRAVAIDSGYRPDKVVPFCDARRGRRVWAVKGDDGNRPPWPVKGRGSRTKRGTVYIVGVHSLRTSLQARLRIVEGAGFIHFPLTVGLEYFEQLNSEFVRTVYKRGRPVRVWERRQGRRAEAWDCAVYATAAVFGLASQGVFVEHEAERVAKLRGDRKPPEPPKPGRFAVRSKYMGGN